MNTKIIGLFSPEECSLLSARQKSSSSLPLLYWGITDEAQVGGLESHRSPGFLDAHMSLKGSL